MTTICKYCNEPEDKQYRPGLICDTCICFVHLTCLRRQGTPGDLACDVFFDFTCEECSPNHKELFSRNRFPWVSVILLTLHHLTTNAYGISNHGFFHYKTHICSFIDRNWSILFDPQFKQKKNWVGTIAGSLSVHSQIIFRSGSAILGEPGWWQLQHAFSPAVASHIIQEIARDKPKGRPRGQVPLDITTFSEKVIEMGYKELLRNEEPQLLIERPAKQRKLDLDYANSFYEQLEADSSRQSVVEETAEGSCSDDARLDFVPRYMLPYLQSDSSSAHSVPAHQTIYYDSDSRSESPHRTEPQPEPQPEPPEPEDKPEKKKVEEKRELTRESMFSKEPNSLELPWIEQEKYEVQKDLVDLTQYEEVQLLKQVEHLIPKVKDPRKRAHLYRLRAKLSLRRLKRHKRLPIFDMDKAVKVLSGQVPEEVQAVTSVERVLDRFQRSYLHDNLCGTILDTNYAVTVLSHIEPSPFRSAYSNTLLKPYIRRDTESRPLWLKVTDELLMKANKKNPDYKLPPHASIDYSYVRPHHIAAINNLCAQFFWPGIDLTEALEYPEFSCVVTYKRLIIGCAFLVPADVAYISFILVRPEWRRAGIATFMLYHLLQTCTGKDVTLHVSPTNPSIFLYQKFGFKVEELVQDFYEKYYDIDYKGCRHALFLRLTR
ncbi:cysteine-rich protein 2-binding protein [Leguminivora glycinivorella]|uniref:cysteine-rich protein 2-binding protein n=1 Tax=Leguminivora glycinivorella TaxID=1035111 RepID=UPI00200D539B|nr:cysteine-rich protein 2-binding protein [Leguminivora glycinivorella]